MAGHGWAITFGTAKMGLSRATACPGPSSLYETWNGQCTNQRIAV